MNVADDGAAVGATILGVLSSLGTIIVYVAKMLRERERSKRMSSVPPTELEPPPPAHDLSVLARLQRADQDDSLVTALLRVQGELVDTQRKLEVLRNENNKLALRVHELEHDNARKDVQLRAERLANRTLREQLAHVEQELATKAGELELAHADLRRALLVRDR